MIEPVGTNLLFAPENLVVEAEISALTPAFIEERISSRWWKDECLKPRFRPRPIDLDWSWEDVEIERDGRILDSMKIGIATGDDEVQGAMLMSTESVETSGREALFVELLFTAPRNRRNLRRDGQDFFVGVGKALLAWAAWYSRELGYGGRLRLDGSPDFIKWYENRGLQKLRENPILYEAVTYTPMELPAAAARDLIASAPRSGGWR